MARTHRAQKATANTCAGLICRHSIPDGPIAPVLGPRQVALTSVSPLAQSDRQGCVLVHVFWTTRTFSLYAGPGGPGSPFAPGSPWAPFSPGVPGGPAGPGEHAHSASSVSSPKRLSAAFISDHIIRMAGDRSCWWIRPPISARAYLARGMRAGGQAPLTPVASRRERRRTQAR